MIRRLSIISSRSLIGLLLLLMIFGCGPVDGESTTSTPASNAYPIDDIAGSGGYPGPPGGGNPSQESAPVNNLSAIEGRLLYQSNASGSFHLFLKQEDGSTTNLTNDLPLGVEGAWSPDGQTIAFVTLGADSTNMVIQLMRANGQDKRLLTDDQPRLNWRPTWSPEGDQLLFVTNRDGNSEVYKVRLDGTNLANLTNNPANDLDPDWSPNSNQILFASDRPDDKSTRQGGNGLYVMDNDGSNVTNLLPGDWNVSYPVWSANGSLIAFTSSQDGTADIYVMNEDGSDIRKVTERPGDNIMPTWVGDDRLVFSGDFGDESWDLYVINVDGSDLMQLTGQAVGLTYSERYPRWSP